VLQKTKKRLRPFFFSRKPVVTILPQKGKWFSQSEVILSPLNSGEVISPTGTVEILTESSEARVYKSREPGTLALIRCCSIRDYHNSPVSQTRPNRFIRADTKKTTAGQQKNNYV